MNPSLSIIALAAANLTPLTAVLLLGWDAGVIVLLYWSENLIIGFYNILKISLMNIASPFSFLGKLFAILFFCLHFGGFCGMHGLFLLALFPFGAGIGSIFLDLFWPGPLAFVQLLVSVITTFWQHHPEGMG